MSSGDHIYFYFKSLFQPNEAKANFKGLGSFKVLPTELFQKICGYVNGRDILNMTLTSKAMNKKISLDAKIMKRIKLRIPNHDKLSEIKFGFRIYPRIEYPGHYDDEFKCFRSELEKIASDVKEITFAGGISLQLAVEVLKLLPDIKAILNVPTKAFGLSEIVDYASILTQAEIESKLLRDPKPINFPSLEILQMSSFALGATIFANCTRLITLKTNALNCIETERLKRFLCKQKRLKHAKIGVRFEQFFLNCENLTTNFKLKTLRLENVGFNMVFEHRSELIRTNLEQFVNKHRETLEELMLSTSFQFLPTLQNFSMLKKLTLSFTKWEPEAVFGCPLMPNVEVFHISCLDRDKIIFRAVDSFPRLKEFYGEKLRINSKWIHNGIKRMGLNNCSFCSLKMRNLEEVEFIEIHFLQKSLIFGKVKRMILNSCKYPGYAIYAGFESLEVLETRNTFIRAITKSSIVKKGIRVRCVDQ